MSAADCAASYKLCVSQLITSLWRHELLTVECDGEVYSVTVDYIIQQLCHTSSQDVTTLLQAFCSYRHF